ncbi:MAG: AarF/UbiB family protein, partial [Pseudobdellovibrionaceae bacterium]
LNQIEAEVQKYMKGEREYRGVPPYKTLMLGASLKEFNSQKGLDNWLVWNSRNLKKAILGESKPSSQFDSTEKEQAQQFLGIFRLKNKKAFASDYQEAFKETLSHSYKTPADLLLAIAAANNSFFANGSLNNRYEITQWDNVYFKKTHLEMIEKSNYTIAEKKAWFEALFLKRTFFPKTEQQKAWNEFNYVIHESNDPNINYMKNPRFAGRILEVYRKLYGQGPLDFFFKLKDFSKNLLSDDTVFFRALDTSENSLQADLKLRSLSNFDELQKIISLMKPRESRKSIYEKSLKYADSTEVAALSNSQAAQINSARIQRLKKTILEKASQLHLTLEQKFQIFLDLTESGPTRDTDQFFASLVDLTKLDPQMKSQVLGYLEEGRFNSDKIKLDLAKVFIGDRVHRLQTEVIDKGSKVDRYTINKLIKDLNRYTPNGSLAKDNFLESIAWSLRLRGSELDGFIEDQKSQNWRKANPMLIRVGSMLATQLSSMSFEGRLKFIEYLLDPVKNETTLFTDIFEDLKKMTYNDLLKEAVSEGNKILSPQKQNELKERADRYAEILKLKAEEAIRDSSPTERIPLFEVVLTAGKEAPIKKSDWPQNIARRYLGYEPGSVEEALLTSFLEILPQHEPAVALAYMLSLSKDESSGSIAQLFEVFGTVGIKFGQLVSIWELFGKKIAKDTAHLKNNAKALTRYDVINIADSRHHEIKEIIEEFEKVLGSASIKTTVRVRFKDGSKGVLALQGKNVQEIVSMNVQLGKRFLERLKQKEVIKNSKFMMNLVEAMEEQIGAELDMKGEALKTKQAGQILEELNKELKADLKGWTIRAPQVLKDKPLTNQLAFYELAGSVSYDQLSPELKAQVGPMIAKANLKSLFKYGWFDPDRHTGNFLIEEKSKTIFFLDFGQFQDFSKSANPFKVDPRLVMGKFIQSLSALDSASVIHYASLMARPGDTSVVDKVQMRKSLDAIFAEAKTQAKPDIKDLMVRAINEIAESGLKFDTRYIFGGLKGLIVLYGENYVSTKDFEGLLRNELQSLFAKKVPALITESFRSPEKSSPGPALRCEGLFLKN